MKINELNIPLFEDCGEDHEEQDELHLQWDEVDAMYNPDQFQIKDDNVRIEKEDEDTPSFTNQPESEELASNGHKGLQQITKYL